MKAILFTARNEAKMAELPDPQPGPGEVLIKSRASGVCHTDTDILKGNYGADAYPVVPGHEFAGEVAALGAGVTGLEVGARVVVDPNFACGTCKYCKMGLPNLCNDLGAYGVTRNGGFEPYVTIATKNVHPIGDLSFEAAALAEPMGCALNGLRSIGTTGAGNALIFGAGPMGMLIAFALRDRGITDITMVDVRDSQLAIATDLGFGALHADSDALSALHHSHDFVTDATGSAKVAEGLLEYTANAGKVLFFSVYDQAARITLSPFELFRRQIRIAGSHSLNHDDIPAAVEVIRRAGAPIEKLVSHKVGLDEAMAIMQGAPLEGRMKVQAVM